MLKYSEIHKVFPVFLPYKDDKPKYTKITLLKAGLDYSLSAKTKYYLLFYIKKEERSNVLGIFLLIIRTH